MTLVPFDVYPNAGREFGVTVLDACDTGARPTAFNALRRFVPRVPVLKATVGFVDVRSPCTDFGLNFGLTGLTSKFDQISNHRRTISFCALPTTLREHRTGPGMSQTLVRVS